jgi:hypothetical protein
VASGVPSGVPSDGERHTGRWRVAVVELAYLVVTGAATAARLS